MRALEFLAAASCGCMGAVGQGAGDAQWRNGTWHAGAGWPPPRLAPHGWLTYLLEPRFRERPWPPPACRHGPVAPEGALAVLCSNEPEYRALWALGHQLLGEASLARLAGRSRSMAVSLAGRDATIWFDAIDTSAERAVWEQQDDTYRLEERLRGVGAEDWLLDFGGHIGTTALLMRFLAPAANVLTLEPSPWNYILLQLNLLQNVPPHMPPVIAVHAGLGRREGRVQGIHEPTWSWNSAISGSMRGGRPRPSLGTGFNTTMTTLPALLQKFNIETVSLMKLDCEGCEWEITFDWFRRGLWRRIQQLVGEYHLFNPICWWALHMPAFRPVDCYPHDILTRRWAIKTYRLLCREPGPPTYDIDGCTEDHLDMLRVL